MFLEDARPANDRALEVPREMRLSLLRWDYPEKSGHECEEPGAAAASSSSSVAASAARPSTSLTSREDGGLGRAPLAGGSGDEPGAAEVADGRPENDQ